jgi:alanine racemase
MALFICDPENLAHNLQTYRKVLSPSTAVMAVIKSQAYGLGFDNLGMGRFLDYADIIGVATASEARQIRKRVGTRIVVFNPLDHNPLPFLSNTFPVVYSVHQTQRAFASPVWVCYDVDLGRFGIDNLDDLRTVLKQLGDLVVGVFVVSKWSLTPWDQVPFVTQDEIGKVYSVVKEHSLDLAFSCWTTTWSIISSPTANRIPSDVARIGIGLYGYSYEPRVTHLLKPVVSLLGRIQKKVAKGQLGGYAGLTADSEPSEAAWVDMGFIHGLPRKQPVKVRCLQTGTTHTYLANGMESGLVLDPPDIDASEATFEVDVLGSHNARFAELTELATNIHKAYNLFNRS